MVRLSAPDRRATIFNLSPGVHMLSGVHVLLSYTCLYECDHCFLYCSPRAQGTFTLIQVRELLEQSKALGTVEWIFYEGGEPLLFYPLLVESIRLTRELGFQVGVVTNAYQTTSVEDARLWLKPLVDAGLNSLSISNDDFHAEDFRSGPAAMALEAAAAFGLNSGAIAIDRPCLKENTVEIERGKPVEGGDTLFKGRAADTLTADLPRRPTASFNTCPHEELVNPERIHVDAGGEVHICQGISIGNVWLNPLAEVMKSYDPETHPIVGPLTRGGPARLLQEMKIQLADEFVDECHCCFVTRRKLLDQYPQVLRPELVYGR